MIKIFTPKKTIYLISNQAIFSKKKDSVLINIQSAKEMLSEYNKLENENKLNEIYFFNKNIKKLCAYFYELFRIIDAAGGLVKNRKDEYLFIFRNGKWDLPKGKVEKKESINTAAIREVEEECGISNLTIIRELPATFHTYFIENKAILKRTYWFEMLCDDTSELVPQIEEGITDVQWIAKTNFKKVFNNTFESVKEVLNSENIN